MKRWSFSKFILDFILKQYNIIENNPLLCVDISQLADTISGLMTYSKNLDGGIFWHCGMCEMQMKRKHNMKRHVEAFHVSGFVHSCNICGSKHKTKAAVEAHMYQNHRENEVIAH